MELRKVNDSAVKLTVRDSGAGIERSAETHLPSSLGMQLITTLTTQLEGNLEMKTDRGFAVSVEFRLPTDDNLPVKPRHPG